MVLLQRVVALVEAKGYRPSNVDATVVAEEPRLTPHIPAMRRNLAKVLGIAEDRVNVKGTTPKGLGVLGASQGIATIAVACLLPTAARRPGIPSHRARRERHEQ